MDANEGKDQNGVGESNEQGASSNAPIIATDREHAKAMAKAARNEARRRGKRITMSMFVIEPLVTI